MPITQEQIRFYNAVKSGDETASLAALEKVKALNFLNKGGIYGTLHEPIHLVAKKGMVKVLHKIHERGFDLGTADGHCRNILLIAQEAGHTDFAEAAFAMNPHFCLKADVNHVTALHIAAAKNQQSLLTKFLELFREHGDYTAINRVDKLRSRTPLHYAAKGGHTEMVALLLSKGAKAKVFDLDNTLPRHLCPIGNEALESLLKAQENDISLFERCALVLADLTPEQSAVIPADLIQQQQAFVAYHKTQQAEYEKNKSRLQQDHEQLIDHLQKEFPGFVESIDSRLKIT